MVLIRRLLIALLALLAANAAYATLPADTGNYIPVTPLYKTDGTANTTIDPNITPYSVTELTNIPLASTVNRVTTGDANGTGAGQPFCLTTLNGGTCTQAKFRTLIGGTHAHVLCDDPIRNPRQPGASHCHFFFGNNRTNAFSTYASLRGQAASDAAGYDANGTGYWFPLMELDNPFSDGKNYAVRLKYATVYYVENDPAAAQKVAHIPVGLRYVFGFEMDDQWAWLQAILTTANLAQGSTRYTLNNPGTGMMSTEALYTCVGATATGSNAVPGQPTSSKVIANADGSDPYGGTCASGADFYVNISGANCFDGKNLASPGGYLHNIPQVWDNLYSVWVCPYNFYRLPALGLELHFSQQGASDRLRWRLSSDFARATACGCTVPNGTTFHTDWMYGWDSNIFNTIQQNCIGVENHTPHECNSSTISVDGHLKGGYSGEAGPVYAPQVDITTDHFTSSAADMFLIGTVHHGTVSGVLHGMDHH